MPAWYNTILDVENEGEKKHNIKLSSTLQNWQFWLLIGEKTKEGGILSGKQKTSRQQQLTKQDVGRGVPNLSKQKSSKRIVMIDVSIIVYITHIDLVYFESLTTHVHAALWR